MLHDTATIQANHARFLNRVVESEIVWALDSADGVAVCPSNDEDDDDEETPVLMFWSDRAYAARVKQSAFPEYDTVEIPLFDFLFRWLPGMDNDNALAGTNWNGDLAGLEVEPLELQDQLLEAMGKERAGAYIDRLKRELKR